MPVTPFQFSQMLARTQRNSGRVPTQGEPVERERDLHDEIIQFCRDKGWFFVHSRMDRRSTNAVGTPDFIIAGDMGNTYWVECKAGKNKATIAQLSTIAHLQKLKHCAGIVSNMDEFRALINRD